MPGHQTQGGGSSAHMKSWRAATALCLSCFLRIFPRPVKVATANDSHITRSLVSLRDRVGEGGGQGEGCQEPVKVPCSWVFGAALRKHRSRLEGVEKAHVVRGAGLEERLHACRRGAGGATEDSTRFTSAPWVRKRTREAQRPEKKKGAKGSARALVPTHLSW